MKVTILGHLGSIGSRYRAILKWLGVETIGYDLRLGSPSHEYLTKLVSGSDGTIIATPTDCHLDHCKLVSECGKTFLVEKPLSKHVVSNEDLSKLNGYVVNNYQFCIGKKKAHLNYDFYKTGSDGLWWDVCQLLYIDENASVRTESPVWMFHSDGEEISYKRLEQSYILMLMCWLKTLGWTGESPYDADFLWSVRDGNLMTQAVLERIRREELAGNSSS